MARGLTVAQDTFVAELVKGKSQRAAYRIAYPSSIKWKDSAVDSKASTLFRQAKARERYDELLDIVAKELENQCVVTASEIIRELRSIGFSDIKDYLSFKTEKQVVDVDDEGKPIYDYRPVVEIKDSDKVDGRVIQEVSINSKGVFSFKMHSKMDALEKMGRHLKMFTDRVEQTIDSEIVVRMEGLEDYNK